MHIDAISMALSIMYFKGSAINISIAHFVSKGVTGRIF